MPTRHVAMTKALSTRQHLRGMGLSARQIAMVSPDRHKALLKHMAGGNAFTDFFTKTIPDAFSKKNITNRFLNPLRDFVNPVIAKALPFAVDKLPLPGASALSGLISKGTDAYLSALPPKAGPFVRGGRKRRGGMAACAKPRR